MRRVSLAFEALKGCGTFGSKTESEVSAGPVGRFPSFGACSGLERMKVRPEDGLCLISTVNDRRACFRKMVSQFDRVDLRLLAGRVWGSVGCK